MKEAIEKIIVDNEENEIDKKMREIKERADKDYFKKYGRYPEDDGLKTVVRIY